jgi:hypothetical protein
MAVPNLGDLVVSTLAKWDNTLADTITNEHPVLNRMASKGNVTPTSNGREIYEPIIYGDNPSVKWFDNYEIFTPPTDQQILDAAVYQWKQQGGFISISGKEQIMNSGESREVSFVEARIKQIMAQLKNDAGQSVYSLGTGSGGKELGGLQLLVADNPAAAGTVGGIDQVANTFWRNKFNTTVTGTTTTIGVNIRTAMNNMTLQQSVGTEKPDLITMDINGYQYYETTLQELVRFTQTKKADSGFDAIAFQNADVVYDAYCPANHIYMLNTDSLFLRAVPERMWTRGEKRVIQNADYEVIPIWFMGNLVTNNRRRQGVITFTVS